MGEVITGEDVSSSSTASPSPASLPSNIPLLSAFLAFALAQFLKIFTTCSTSSLSPASLLPSSISLLSAFLAFTLAQILKFFITWYKEKRWDTRRMISSGGMPSSHSATVTALAVAVGLHEGTGGSAFAVAVVLACVVMYDASGVRLHAGRQAELLNQIVCEFPPEHPLSSARPLHDSLGHTPFQVVAGAVLGCVVAYLMKNSN